MLGKLQKLVCLTTTATMSTTPTAAKEVLLNQTPLDIEVEMQNFALLDKFLDFLMDEKTHSSPCFSSPSDHWDPGVKKNVVFNPFFPISPLFSHLNTCKVYFCFFHLLHLVPCHSIPTHSM